MVRGRLAPLGRGPLAGRRHDSTWVADGVVQREVAVAGLDGWMGFALVVWMPDSASSRPDGLEAVTAGLAARGLLAARLREAVDAVVSQVPHLTVPAAANIEPRASAVARRRSAPLAAFTVDRCCMVDEPFKL